MIGRSVASRFAREGLAVSVLARSQETVDATVSVLGEAGHAASGFLADSTDEASLRRALDEAVERHGVPDAFVYNAAMIRADDPGQLSASELLETLSVNVVGAIVAATHIAPRMVESGHGTIILTGGMPQPVPSYFSLSLGKAGVRAVTSLLAKEYGPAGIHVATITVYGAVTPGGPYDPDEIADCFWRVHTQPRDEWVEETAFVR